MKKIIILVIGIFSSYCLLSQTKNNIIRGMIADSASKENLTGATIQLISGKDSLNVRKTVNEKNGFLIRRVAAGHYHLLISYVGYKDSILTVNINNRDSIYNMGVLLLNRSSAELMEVVIKAAIPPMIMKSDTVIYNTEAFKTRPYATVEELLKKLPGIEVDQDGNITFHGERVNKIYIDGKEFLLNDPKLVTQNLTADMVLRVEAFDDKSQRAKLTGIPDESPGKAINLRLKSDKKKGISGNAEGGYASANRRGIRITASHLKANSYLIGAVSSSNGGDIFSGSGKGNSYFMGAAITSAGGGGPGTLNNKVNNFFVNYFNNWSEAVRGGVGYNGVMNNNKYSVVNHRQTFFGDSSLLQNRESLTSNKASNHDINVSMNYAIDSLTELTAGASFSLNENKNNNSDISNTSIEKNTIGQSLNSAYSNNYTSNSGNAFNLKINYSHKFRKQGRFFGVNVNDGINHTNGDGKLESQTRFYNSGVLIDSQSRNQISKQKGRGFNLGFSINYTEPIAKGQVLDLTYSMKNSKNDADQNTLNYNRVSGKYDTIDSVASNYFENKDISQELSLGYNYFKGKFRYQAGISLAESRLENNVKSDYLNNIIQKIVTIFPRASFSYTMSNTKNLKISYNGSNLTPSIEQLRPVPDYSNPLLVHIGNPALKQEFNNSISLGYMNLNLKSSRSIICQLNFENSFNTIANSTVTNPQGIQEQQYVNVNGNYTIRANITNGFPLGKVNKNGNINLNTHFIYGHDISIVNGIENLRKTFAWGERMMMSYHPNEKFFANAGAGFSLNQSSYSIQSTANGTFFSQNYVADISYEFPGQVVLGSNFNLSYNNSVGTLAGKNSFVWNATIAKQLFKSRAGELKFSVFDILNNNNGFTQSAGDNYIETKETEVLRRVFLLSFKYRFTIN